MKDKISIIGCGWLGFPLAKRLIKNNITVRGSTTSESKLKLLHSENILAFIVRSTAEGIVGDIKECLQDSKTLILNIPPAFRKNPTTDYLKQMSFFIQEIEASGLKNVLFISSTSVYEDDPSFPLINEKSQTSKSFKASQLVATENLFRNNSNFNTTVLRFSGLFGNDRHPAKFLAGRTGLKNPEAPVNLIHLEDCLRIIETIVYDDHWNILLNASSKPHPTKKNYYSRICEQMGLPGPKFDNETLNRGKIIDSSLLEKTLNYKFQVKL